MADANKSATLPRHQSNAGLEIANTGQTLSQRWLREFRIPTVREAQDAAVTPVRRHIDEYA